MDNNDCITIDDDEEEIVPKEDMVIENASAVKEHVMQTWEILNSTIITIFTNQDTNSDPLNSFESIMRSILNYSPIFSELFSVKADPSTAREDYINLQSQYDAFSMWLVGRLFYVLAQDNFSRAHDISIEAQTKVFNELYTNNISSFCRITDHYFKCLYQLVDSHRSNEGHPQNLQIFFTNKPVKVENLNLSPVIVHVKNSETSFKMLQYIQKMILKILPPNLPFRWHNDVTSKIFEYTNKILCSHDLKFKLYVVVLYTNIIKTCSMTFFNNNTHFKAMIKCMENVLYHISDWCACSDNDGNDLLLLNEALTDLFDTIRKTRCEGNEKNYNLLVNFCLKIISYNRNEIIHNNLRHASCELARSLLEMLNTYDISFLRKYIWEFKHNVEAIFVAEYCVLYELQYSARQYILNSTNNDRSDDDKEPAIFVTNISETWKLLSDELQKYLVQVNKNDTELLNHNLELCYLTLKCAIWVDIEFSKWHQNIHFEKLNYLCNKQDENLFCGYNSMELEFFDKSVNTITYLFLKIINEFEHLQSNLKIFTICVKVINKLLSLNELIYVDKDNILKLIGVLTSPYISYLSMKFSSNTFIHGLISKNFCTDIQSISIQELILEYLSFCYLDHCGIDNNVLNSLVLPIFKSCLFSKHKNIAKKAIEQLPYLYINKSVHADQLVTELINPVLQSNNDEWKLAMTRVFPKLICISAGNIVGTTINLLTETTLRIICFNCDSRNIEISKKKYELKLLDGRLHYFPMKPLDNLASLGNVHHNFWQLFQSERADIRKHAVSMLPPLFNHSLICYKDDKINICLKFCCDDDLEVRKVFGRVFKKLLTIILGRTELTGEDLCRIKRLIETKMLHTLKRSLEENDDDLQYSVLLLIRDYGIINDDEALIPCTKMFIFFFTHPMTKMNYFANMYFRDICKSNNLTPHEVYHRYKKDFCKMLMDVMVYNFLNGCDFRISTRMASLAFGYKGYCDFFSMECNHTLPILIPWLVKHPRAEPLLNHIADLISRDPSSLLYEHFSTIYPHIYLTEPPEITEKCLKFITKTTNCTETELYQHGFRLIIGELLINYHSKPTLVINAIRLMAPIELDYNSLEKFNTTGHLSISQVADFINPRFLSVMANFDSKLVNNQIADSVKRKAMESLPDIIRFMGSKYITPIRYKILATLRSAFLLRDKFRKLIINAWLAFIYTVDVQSLGSLLSTIFVSLIPLLDDFPTEVNKIFQYLIVSNENLLSVFIPDLFFLSETKISNEVIKTVEKHINRAKSDSLVDNLKIMLPQVNHENVEVRLYGIRYVTKLLSENKQQLNIAILSSDKVHPVIEELIEALVTGCCESEGAPKLEYGKCLGELGAVEPSHLPRKHEQESGTFIFSAEDDSFAMMALTELARALQYEKNTKYMDCFALGIQEILQNYKISPTGNKVIWDSFSEKLQEIMYPMLTSRYIVPLAFSPAEIHPVFGSPQAPTFSEWAFKWAGILIFKVNNQKLHELFKACIPSLKRDLRVLIMFLPYIMLHALFSGLENVHNSIYEEVEAVIGLGSFKKRSSSFVEDKVRAVPTLLSNAAVKEQPTEEDSQIKCSKMTYVLLDFLDRWLREWKNANCPKIINPLDNAQYKSVSIFLQRFCKSTISQGNFLCGEYPRALMYLESHIDISGVLDEDSLSQLAQIYAKLEEPDALTGVMCLKQNEPSLPEQILFHELKGQLQDAAACYERMAQEGQLKYAYIHGMIQCYLGLDQPFTAYRLADSMSNVHTEMKSDLFASQAEPLWRLGMFDQLNELVEKKNIKNSSDWGVRIGHLILCLRNGQREKIRLEMDSTRTSLMSCLSTASIEHGAYKQGYPSIIKLHILNEFEKAEEVVYKIQETLNSNEWSSLVDKLLFEWEMRLNLVQSSERIIEPILCIRRIVLEQAKVLLAMHPSNIGDVLDRHIAKLWLKSVQVARKAGLYQQAYTYVLNAESYKLTELFIEKAKLHWQKGEQSAALRALRRGIDEHFPDANKFKTLQSLENRSERKLCAQAKLLIAKYNDDSVHVDMEENIAHYKEATEVFKEWEKSLVCLAQFYDKIYSQMTESEQNNKGGALLLHVMNCFCKSLEHGCHYIYQSIPRILSIWLDYCTVMPPPKSDKRIILNQMTKLIEIFSNRLPSFMFLTAFSQIVSRICHPINEVYLQLKSIIIKLILKYPQQSMWMIMSVFKSGYAARFQRCQEVLQDPLLKKNALMIKLIEDFNSLADNLITLTNKIIPDGMTKTSVSALVKFLPKLLRSSQFSEIMMPVQEFIKLILPPEESKGGTEINRNLYNAFPTKLVYITAIEEEVIVIQSLQKPRRVTFKGSDGKSYIIMLKPRDDLRRDFRLMEFNEVVNQYLHKDSEARQRRLKIRTYSVIPLNEECGLIEWVPNLVGFRPILMEIYKRNNIQVKTADMKAMKCENSDPFEKKKRVFEQMLLPRHPPLFPEWFRFNFPDPQGWYQARCAYTRTTAVISMVGYILGIGDRHGENIQFDSKNGDTVHVDFNCLFNKGETFEVPERVPFRLTHNMVKAMGPMGVEGMYRRSCEITLKVLRAQTDTLMSVVRPFVYDPLVSWSTKSAKTETAERTDKGSMQAIAYVEQRLKGVVTNKAQQFSSSLSLSPDGQVNSLILEATSVDNLCQMYIGWGPFL